MTCVVVFYCDVVWVMRVFWGFFFCGLIKFEAQVRSTTDEIVLKVCNEMLLSE